MKYIDAERLRAEIERRIDILGEVSVKQHKKGDSEMSTYYHGKAVSLEELLYFIDSIQQETSEISLEKFTEKMEDWKARYNHPDNIPIKATMAFTARMFYMYPDIAREWYDCLLKATQD